MSTTENDIKEIQNKDDSSLENYTIGVIYKNTIGKLLPLSFVVTEIENYLENSGTGDSLMLVSRSNFMTSKETNFKGIEIVLARSRLGKEFTVFYKPAFNQFGLFLRKQIGKDNFDYDFLHAWNVVIEDSDWFENVEVANPV